MLLVAISLLFGMVLGQRFKVAILLPAIGFALMVVICTGVARGEAVWPIVLLAAAATTTLQLGYLAGIGIRYVLVAARASRSRGVSLAGSGPHRRPAH